jgi:hypothetical protein
MHAPRSYALAPALAYFKYANLGLQNAGAALGWLGLHVDMPRVTAVLPIGISFHSFHIFQSSPT